MASGVFRLIAPLIAGCGLSVGEPFLFSGQAEAQTESSAFEVPYITLRNRTGEASPDKYYGDERSGLSAGRCKIDATDMPFMSTIAENLPFRVPEEVLRISSVEEIPVDRLFDEVDRSSAGKGPVLYIHGYKIDFDKACRRASVFQRNAGIEGRLILFSWPSDGDAVNYMRDEADLGWSVPDIADILAGMVDRFGQGKVNLVGHSLGGRGAALAMYDFAGRYPDMRLDQVVLMAPDMDFQLFQKILPQFRPSADGVTLYVADADRPLALSATLHGYPRLGQSGNDVESLERVEVFDLSDLPIRSASGHLYHVYNAEVGQDVARLVDGIRDADLPDRIRIGSNLWRLQPSGN